MSTKKDLIKRAEGIVDTLRDWPDSLETRASLNIANKLARQLSTLKDIPAPVKVEDITVKATPDNFSTLMAEVPAQTDEDNG